MNVAADVLGVVDKVGLVPGLTLAKTLVTQIWQALQVRSITISSL
jgi:hypothetical protein